MTRKEEADSVNSALFDGQDERDLQCVTIEVPLPTRVVECLDMRANHDGTTRRAVTKYFVNAVLDNIRKTPRIVLHSIRHNEQSSSERVLVGVTIDASDYCDWNRYAQTVGKDVPEYVASALAYQMKRATRDCSNGSANRHGTSSRNRKGRTTNIRTFKIDYNTVISAAAAVGKSPEDYISRIATISCDRKICAHLDRVDSNLATFSLYPTKCM